MSSRLSFRPSVAADSNALRVQPEIFKHRLLSTGEETLASLQAIWKEAGYEENECQKLLGDLLTKIKTTCTTELEAERQILEHAKTEVLEKSAEYKDLCAKLGRIGTDLQYIDGMNYTLKLAELEKLITSIAEEVSSRQGVIDREMGIIRELVSCLGEAPPSEDVFAGPAGTPLLSDVRLQLMREYVVDLESIRSKRVEDVKTIAKDCYKHMTDMMYVEERMNTMKDSEQYRALDEAVVTFFKSNDFTFSLHKREIANMTVRLKSLVEEKERRRTELARVGAEIARLWTLLRVHSSEREAFQASFKMNLSMETLSKGHEELERLKEIRTTSLGKVINCIRSDILSLWEEAGIDCEEDRRKEFPLYFAEIDRLEDSAVDSHEEYFSGIRQRVEELRPLLQKIVRREAIVQERIELEHLQMRPERLSERGGKAREERKKEELMTNRVRNLEKITKELLNQIGTWEAQHGPFVYMGEKYSDRVQQQDDSYIEVRDSLRASRKKQKDGKTPDVTALLSSKTVVPPAKKHSTIVPGSASKASKSSATATVLASSALASAKVQPVHIGGKSLLPVPAAASAAASSRMQQHQLRCDSDDAENMRPPADDNSNCADGQQQGRESEGTQFTSATEVKERNLSNGSTTVVRATEA